MIGIIRHGDRTPKQKMKMIVSHRKFYDVFEELNGYATGHIKIKAPEKMQVQLCQTLYVCLLAEWLVTICSYVHIILLLAVVE